jgi:6,7-dimethyl-8-ribityllumazine synthase
MTFPPKVAFIKARWHAEIVDQAFQGFVDSATELMPGILVKGLDVPGAFEIPLVAKKLAATGEYDAIVAAAFVVNGGIYRHDFVAGAVVTALMNVGLESGVPCFSISLTPHNYQPTEALDDFFFEHFLKKGVEAARAVRDILALQL